MKRGERAYVIVAPTGFLNEDGDHEVEAAGFAVGRSAKGALRRFRRANPDTPDGAYAYLYVLAEDILLAQARDAEAMAYESGG